MENQELWKLVLSKDLHHCRRRIGDPQTPQHVLFAFCPIPCFHTSLPQHPDPPKPTIIPSPDPGPGWQRGMGLHQLLLGSAPEHASWWRAGGQGAPHPRANIPCPGETHSQFEESACLADTYI